MTLRSRVIILLVTIVAAAPALAEPTPALPFWSRPFPTGFVRRHALGDDSVVVERERCVIRTIVRADGSRRVVSRRSCRGPLQVMD